MYISLGYLTLPYFTCCKSKYSISHETEIFFHIFIEWSMVGESVTYCELLPYI